MNVCCKEVIEPSVKLARMVTLLKILEFLFFALILLDIFVFDTGIFFLLLFQFLFLLIGISSKHFGYLLANIMISLLYLYTIISRLGVMFQVGFTKKSKPLGFGFLSFTTVFQIFAIYVVFQVYKQAKHEYRIKYGYVPGNEQNDDNEQIDENANLVGVGDNNEENDNEHNGNNNAVEFEAFQGNGVPVGGN